MVFFLNFDAIDSSLNKIIYVYDRVCAPSSNLLLKDFFWVRVTD